MYNLDLSSCMSRQPRQEVTVKDALYKTEDLSQYMAAPVKAIKEVEEVIVEAVEVSTNTVLGQVRKGVLTNPIGFTPCVHKPTNNEWWAWLWETKALSKEYKLLLFEAYISQLS